jgi:hypothetical protein
MDEERYTIETLAEIRTHLRIIELLEQAGGCSATKDDPLFAGCVSASDGRPPAERPLKLFRETLPGPPPRA